MYSWYSIIPLILRNPPHVDMFIPSHLVPDPRIEGFKETLGWPQGQIADYELTLKDGRRIHVRKFKEFYKAHWDMVSPLIDIIGHLRYDAPQWWITLLGIGGAGVGALLYKEDRTTSAIIGGLIGILVAGATLP
ncbi:MAG: hypothetical protein P3X22_001030 [Thermoprotei archaeon]|nr:hypothetical protein [Thermoprotei archaeon]